MPALPDFYGSFRVMLNFLMNKFKKKPQYNSSSLWDIFPSNCFLKPSEVNAALEAVVEELLVAAELFKNSNLFDLKQEWLTNSPVYPHVHMSVGRSLLEM